ncbi:MAG: S41 family peptidase [Anaerolineales bacterium]
MNNRVVLTIFAVFMVLALVSGACIGGFAAGRFTAPQKTVEVQVPGAPQTIIVTAQPQGNGAQPQATVQPPAAAQPSASPEELQQLFAPFWEAWTILHQNYVDQPLDDEALMRGAIDGMMQSLGDQHTAYMDPDQFLQSSMSLDGEYEGIGAWVDTNAEYLTIVSPMPGSPAEKAGLKPGDEIVTIDGKDMTGIDGNVVIRSVLGPANSQVILGVRREGETKLLEFTITRAKIVVPSVESKMLEGNIAYVHLFTFGEKTSADLEAALKTLMAQNPKGLILDLRNNGGGYLQTAIEVASQFIPAGQVVMHEDYGNGERDTYTALRGGLATEIPMVVLVNEGTASASEIVSGAIQDYGRGTLVGVTTFGKGSVQTVVPLSNEEGAVRVTVARWLTPKDRQIHKVGLTPDVKLAVFTQEQWDAGIDLEAEGLTEADVVILTADEVKAQRDPQLEKAIELLNR